MPIDRVRRRAFITLLGGAAAAWPLAAHGQQTRMRRVGVLMGYAETDPAAQAQVAALRQELQKLGWEEGRNIRIDVRFPAADAGRVRAILMELMSLTPDVLVSNTNFVTAVVQAEVHTIPIVFIFVGDPVGSGFVSNDARPNGNLTGFANWDSSAMSGKWLELLKEVAPQVERIGFMMHSETPAHIRYFKSAEALAPALKVKLVALGVHDADEIERAMAAFAAEGNGGVIVAPHAVTLTNRDLIVALAARLRLPALYPLAFYAKAGASRGLTHPAPPPITWAHSASICSGSSTSSYAGMLRLPLATASTKRAYPSRGKVCRSPLADYACERAHLLAIAAISQRQHPIPFGTRLQDLESKHVTPELEEVYRACQVQQDDYIKQWSAAVGKFLEAKGYKRQEGGKPQPSPA